MKSIVTIGGGTGQYALLSGLKRYPVRLTAIVSMADDGGSTGVLRDEHGVLPPGDVRQCLVALSESDELMRRLFNYRYENGGLKGHSFGNIFLTTLELTSGSFEDAVAVASRVLAVRGSVIPVCTGGMTLVGGHEGQHRGESQVSHAELPIETLRLEPESYANPRAVEALEQADAIVIGPGNLFSSIIPNLLVRGIPEAIASSKARVIYNCNLMTRKGQTDGWQVTDFVRAIERHLGAGRVDMVTVNATPPDGELLERYSEEGQPILAPNAMPLSHVVAQLEARAAQAVRAAAVGLPHQGQIMAPLRPEIVAGDLMSRILTRRHPGDAIRRTLIRHDPDALAALIVRRCIGGV